MRKLLVTTRTVARDRASDYESTWRSLHTAVTGLGASAWRFRHDLDATRYIEFVEWKSADDPTASREGRSAMSALHAIAPGSTDLWIQAEAVR